MTRLVTLLAACLLCVGCSSKTPPTAEPKVAATATAETLPAESSADRLIIQESEQPELTLPPGLTNPHAPVSPPETGKKAKRTEPHKGPMPVYVTPFYNSDGPQINVGDYSQELKDATAETIGDLTTKMKMAWPKLAPEAMYVTAIRLYDLGKKDDAVYWFYSAQFRARLFQSLLHKESPGRIGAEGFERTQAHGAFHTLVGEFVNGYAFGDLPKLQATIERVKSDNVEVPQLKAIYPRLVFVEEKDWPQHNQEIAAGLDKLIEYIKDNADMIKEKRKENGTETIY